MFNSKENRDALNKCIHPEIAKIIRRHIIWHFIKGKHSNKYILISVLLIKLYYFLLSFALIQVEICNRYPLRSQGSPGFS